jgi:hypothetical protein
MFIKFKNNEELFMSSPPTETKLFDAGRKETGWLFGANITVPKGLSSNDVDVLLVPANISEITVYTNEKTENRVISGYNKLQLAIIRNADDLSAVMDIQFTKWNETTQNGG